jgi:hypothetical protein
MPVSNLDAWARQTSAVKQTARHNIKAILEMHIDGIHKVLRYVRRKIGVAKFARLREWPHERL